MVIFYIVYGVNIYSVHIRDKLILMKTDKYLFNFQPFEIIIINKMTKKPIKIGHEKLTWITMSVMLGLVIRNLVITIHNSRKLQLFGLTQPICVIR